jgi:hypothetical protein
VSADAWGPRDREREERVGAARVKGPKGVAGWAGCKAQERRSGPAHWLGNLQIKGLNFELGFEKEFEFDSHSNSNFTHLNSKEPEKNQLTYFTIF